MCALRCGCAPCCCCRALPSSLSNLTALRTLYASHNQFTAWPKPIIALPAPLPGGGRGGDPRAMCEAVLVLDLSFNAIGNVPDAIRCGYAVICVPIPAAASWAASAAVLGAFVSSNASMARAALHRHNQHADAQMVHYACLAVNHVECLAHTVP